MSQPPHPGQAGFRLTLLGSPALLDASGAMIPGLGPGKPLAMLAYLAMTGRADRESLVALLWDNMPDERARNAFRQTLHRLRAALGPEVIVTERDSVAVAGDDALWCDAVEFVASAGAGAVDRPLELYRGPFLGGLDVGSAPFEQWAEEQRHRMAAQYRGVLAQASQRALENGDLDDAVSHAQKLAVAAPLDAEAALLEATALLAAGRKPEAVSALTIFGQRLRSELGAAPPPSIARMLASLLNEHAPRVSGPSREGASHDGLAQPAFVGREAEMGRMLATWRRIDQGGATLVLSGQRGIGKTRLISEFAQRLSSFGPALVLWGQERATGHAVPYAAIAEALRPAINAPGLAGASRHLLAEAARLLPELRDQFDLPTPDAIEDDAARLRFYDGVAALLDAVSYEQPVCVIAENLQLASTSSVSLLEYLTARLASAPVMFVLTYNEAEAKAVLLRSFPPRDGLDAPDGAGADNRREQNRSMRGIRLGPLDEAALVEMVSSMGGGGQLARADIQRVTELSEGVPLKVLEIVRRLRAGQPLTTAPRAISEILWAQLQSCSPLEQRLFLATALYWRTASLRILAAATHLSEPEVLDATLALEKKGLVVQRGGGIAPAHDTIASMALENTGSAGLALLAGWAADALASEPGGTNAELAHLYSLAGQKNSAHRHSRAAVHDAAAAAAYDDVDALLLLAHQTASSETERLAVASLRKAFGGGSKRLASGAARPTRAAQAAESDATSRPDVLPEEADAGEAAEFRAPLMRRRYALTLAAFALVGLAAIAIVNPRPGEPGPVGILQDTLVVLEKLDVRSEQRFYLSGLVALAPSLARARTAAEFAWTDSVALPWLNPRVSPDGRLVAVERMTPEGTDLYVIRADRSDTVGIAIGPGDDIAAGWSPDGQWLLATRGSTWDGGYDTDLFAYSVTGAPLRVTLDVAPDRSVVDAAWSPRGTMIAWVARVGDTRQQDVFISDARGRGRHNLTDHPSEDYHLAWAPDGKFLTFTTDRTGNAELYSIEIATGSLRRLTINAAHDDRAAYSPDGNFIAFESTRAGSVGVYLTKPAGGNPRRVTPADRNFELDGWRGRPPPFIARIRLAAPDALSPRDSAILTAHLSDQFGSPVDPADITWESSGQAATLRPEATPDTAVPSPRAVLRASRDGLAQIVASVGGWRDDTAYVRVGDVLSMTFEGFDSGIDTSRWIPLGAPAPGPTPRGGRGGSVGLSLNADNQWESGVLSRRVFPLRAGVSVSGWISAPFAAPPMPANVGLWLVAAEAESALDRDAPQFLKVAGITWLGEAARIAYSAEREFSTELAGALNPNRAHSFRMTVDSDNRLSFYIDGTLRRRSTVRVTRPGAELRVQLWVGGKGTGSAVVVDDLQVSVGRAQ